MLQAGAPLPDEVPEDADSRDGRLAAFEEALAEVAARVEVACREADGWLERTRAGLVELLRFCDERPATARALVVDSIAWGPAVLRRRGQLLDELADALDGARAEIDRAGAASRGADAPGDPLGAAPAASAAERPGEPPPGTAENLVGACVSMVHTRLLGEGSCLELAPPLLSMIAHPYLGLAAARRELDRPHTYLGAEADRREPGRPLAAVRERSY
jgi:hypothetical protein